jgi:hypothetical protein
MGAYSNPKWYGGDPLAFTKGFEKSFSENYASAEGYFQQKIENRKKYLESVDAQIEKMREERIAAEAAGENIVGDIEEEINNFYKAATKVDKQDTGFFGQLLGKDVKETRLSKQYMDKATNTFNNQNTAINIIADRAFGEFSQELDFDHDNPNYRLQQDLTKAFKSYRKGEGTSDSLKYKFNEEKGEFEFSIEIPEREYDPATGSYKETGKKRTVSSSEIIAMSQDLSPEDRATYEETKTKTITSLANRAKTKIEEKYADETVKLDDGQKKAILASYNSRQIVEEYIENTSASNSEREGDGFDLVTKMYANSVDFNDAKKVSILKEKFPDLVARFEGSPNSLESLELILNSSPSDQAGVENILDKVQDKDGNNIFKPEELQGALKNINEGFKEITKEYLVEELIKEGIGSKVAKGDPLKNQASGSGGKKQYDGTDDYTVMQGEKTARVSQRTVNAISTFGSNIPSFGIKLENGERVYTNPAAGEFVSQEVEDGIINDFLNAEFTFGGSKHNASGFEMGRDGKVTLTFDKMTRDVDVIGTKAMYDSGQINKNQIGKKVGSEPEIFTGSTLEYDIYNPESMRNFFDATSTEAGGTGDYARDFKSKGYNIQMVSNFTKPSGLESLNKPKMGAWLKFVDEKGGHDKLIQYAAANPEVLESGEIHWAEFSKKYRKEIDQATIASIRATSFNQ